MLIHVDQRCVFREKFFLVRLVRLERCSYSVEGPSLWKRMGEIFRALDFSLPWALNAAERLSTHSPVCYSPSGLSSFRWESQPGPLPGSEQRSHGSSNEQESADAPARKNRRFRLIGGPPAGRCGGCGAGPGPSRSLSDPHPGPGLEQPRPARGQQRAGKPRGGRGGRGGREGTGAVRGRRGMEGP